jgi:hypothetical protein
MTRALKSLADLSLKVITVGASDNRKVALQMPVSNLLANSPPLTTLLEQLMERRRDPPAETHGWRHGGIND